MSGGEIAFLGLVVGGLTLFAGVLAWASWMESRERKAKALAASAQPTGVGRIPANTQPKMAHRAF